MARHRPPRTGPPAKGRPHNKPGASSGGRARRAPQHVWQVSEDALVVGVEAGSDLAHYLAETFTRIGSIRQVRRLLAERRCRVNGQVETFGSRVLRKGDIVEFNPPAPKRERKRTVFEPARLLHDADGVVVYDKPPHLAVTPTADKHWDLLHLLRKPLGELLPVHRLDADTTGAVVLARNAAVQQRLEEAFRSRRVEKHYRALVRGHPPETGERRSFLVCKESQPGLEKWGSGKNRSQGALFARTSWTVLRHLRHGAVVAVEPHSGRYHQIRIHFAEMGCPLIGDALYGDRADPIDVPRHMLHAERLSFPDPAGGRRRISVTAAEPEDFRDAVARLDKVK
ncbi:MAG: RluA family pseudouridine synthase [Planctomycetota bacterium]